MKKLDIWAFLAYNAHESKSQSSEIDVFPHHTGCLFYRRYVRTVIITSKCLKRRNSAALDDIDIFRKNDIIKTEGKWDYCIKGGFVCRYSALFLELLSACIEKLEEGIMCRISMPSIRVKRLWLHRTARLLEGSFPRNKMKLLDAWMEIHREDLEANWKLLSNGEQFFRIDPLK